jgi:hypothetical protein
MLATCKQSRLPEVSLSSFSSRSNISSLLITGFLKFEEAPKFDDKTTPTQEHLGLRMVKAKF